MVVLDGLFHLRGKKVTTGCIRQVFILYSNNCMGICLGRLNIGHLRWVVYRGCCLNRFDCTNNSTPFSEWENYFKLSRKKSNLFSKYFCLNTILYQMTVSYQKIKHIQGIIQKKSESGSRMLPCLIIFSQNFILIWKCQKWYLNRGTLVSVTKQSAPSQF